MLGFDGIPASPAVQAAAAAAAAEHVLISAAPGEAGDPVLRALFEAGCD